MTQPDHVEEKQDGSIAVGKSNKELQDEEIDQKRSQADETAPDPKDINGPPWNTAVLLYLQSLDKRMERIEEELGIEE